MTPPVSVVIGHYQFMEVQSELDKRMKAEESAAMDLQELWEVYQGNRTPENRAEYWEALRAFSKLITGEGCGAVWSAKPPLTLVRLIQ